MGVDLAELERLALEAPEPSGNLTPAEVHAAGALYIAAKLHMGELVQRLRTAEALVHAVATDEAR